MLLDDINRRLLPVVMGTRVRGNGGSWWLSRQYQRRPCGRRDPYAVLLVLRDTVRCHRHKLLPVVMVPACAGTTSRRHCERSEAIHREAKQKAGLLRCARNDDINRDTPTATHTSPISRRGCARVVQDFSLS